jgi:ATP-dependent helicase Lhr and Lhr-like helicase
VDPLAHFTASTRSWFEAAFAAPTEAQARGWPAIASGSHTLIHAPTGSGKTLAAFLWTIDRLFHEPPPATAARCRVVYVSPLKALAYDVDRNLRAPLAGIRHTAERLGYDPLPEIRTFLRTGDTPADDRRRMLTAPPDVLITTPESLFLILSSRARATLAPVRWVIVDEIHALAGTKRGAHLAISLERLAEVAESPPQRIGLSATQRPLETIARFLGGGERDQGARRDRPVTIVDVPGDRPLELEIVVPVEDMAEPAPPDPLEPDEQRTRSIWPAVYPRILELILAHRSTIVFANSRRLAERICAEINTLAGTEIARAHHGSVARDQRVEIEEALKRGDLRAVVATSSLELGIDMGAVDLVVQVEAPISVASGLQRVGRSGHEVGGTARATIFPKHRGDLLLATVVAQLMLERRVEETVLPRNPLDVLAQHLVAAVADGERRADDLFELTVRAASFAELPRSAFDATLDMLSGRYPSDLFSELRPRLTWDRVSGAVAARPGARQLVVANAGTIPDRGLYRVALPEGGRVGELDEEMVYESRVGDVFLLGSSSWRIVEIGPDRVEVVPAPGEPGAKMPFWHGDALGRSLETGRAVGRFVREIAEMDSEAARETLTRRYALDPLAATNLVEYLREQREVTGTLPSDTTIVAERFRDEIGDWRLVLLSPLGARVHAPWAMALVQRLRGRWGTDVDVIWSDDGIALRFPDADEAPTAVDLALDPDEVEELVVEHLGDSALFAARFREAAARSLLLPRRRPGSRTPLWLQRRKSADLLAVARRFGSFPIVLEAYREVLQDDFDLPSLRSVLAGLRERRLRLVEVDTPRPSPFAASLLFAFVAAYLYEGDTPLAERRAAALTLDRDLLSELLGEGELRELLSAEVIEAVELDLQHLSEERRLTGLDAVHDLLRTLGPLSERDLEARTRGTDVAGAIESLAGVRRVIRVRAGGLDRWAAVEDAARLRDGCGIQPPPGVPQVFLEPVDDPLGDVVGRFARTHGPFTVDEAAGALALPDGAVLTALRRLETEGRVVPGAFRPGGDRREWVDAEVLRRLKRRSLAALRAEIEPSEPSALARFLPAWHQAAERPLRGAGALADAVRRLQGAEIPASVLERDVLAARVEDAGPRLDAFMISGDLVWVGRGSLGPRDGRVALYLRDRLPLLWRGPMPDPPDGPLHAAIVARLEDRGASFFPDLYAACGGGDPSEVADALWDLVWSALVTNDTLAPLRAFLARSRAARTTGRRAFGSSSFPPDVSGRWSLVSDLVTTRPSDTEQMTAWAEQLLDRHGILTRPAVAFEGIAGGFSGLYPVLTRMEDTGRVRRGYFVEGLGGAQFAVPGAIDRIRTETAPGVVALAATDPANPYGAALPWPTGGDARLARVPGAYVVLLDGAPAAFADGRRLRLFVDDPELWHPIAAAVGRVASRHRRFRIEEVDGVTAGTSRVAGALAEAGFAAGPRGLVHRGR